MPKMRKLTKADIFVHARARKHTHTHTNTQTHPYCLCYVFQSFVLTPWREVLLEKLTFSWPTNYTTLYETRRSTIAFTSDRQWSLSCVRRT